MIGKLTKKEIHSVLGLDVSTNSCAYCLYDNTGPVEWGEIKFEGATVFERIADGQKKVAKQLKHIKPDLIIFESAVFVQNKKTVVLLAYSFGAIVAALMQPGIVIEETPPITWQAAIKNRPIAREVKEQYKVDHPGYKKSWYDNKFREMRKQFTWDWVNTKYGIKADNDNISDAVAIASVGHNKFAVDSSPLT